MLKINRFLVVLCVFIFSGVATAAYVNIQNINIPKEFTIGIPSVTFVGKGPFVLSHINVPDAGQNVISHAKNGTYQIAHFDAAPQHDFLIDRPFPNKIVEKFIKNHKILKSDCLSEIKQALVLDDTYSQINPLSISVSMELDDFGNPRVTCAITSPVH